MHEPHEHNQKDQPINTRFCNNENGKLFERERERKGWEHKRTKRGPRATGKFSMYCTTVQLLVNGSIIINRVFDKKN